MIRKLIIPVIALAATIAVILVLLTLPDERTVFFSTAQADTNATQVKLRFYATNTAARGVALQVCAIERKDGSVWLADTQAHPANTFGSLGSLEARGHKQLTFQFPYAPGQTRLRVLVSPRATTLQKARFALRRWWANVRGQATHKRFWFSNLAVPTYEVIGPETP